MPMEVKNDKDSRWFEVEFVPENYILPLENRPTDLDVPVSDSLPVIDLAKNTQSVEAILKASQEFGFFQVINHEVPYKTLLDTMSVVKEFFDLPSKEPSGDLPHKKSWIYTNADYNKNVGGYLWRENLKHLCYPLESWIHSWPEKPTRYKEVISDYMREMQKLSLRILEMIGEGLGLEQGYFSNITEAQIFSTNLYPPCPDPSLTLGLLAHQDPTLINIVYQDKSTGLQFLKDGQWINVGAIPNSLIVNIGNQLEIISNGKLKSMYHRVVTSKDKTRISIAASVNPSYDCIVEPAKALVNELEPSCYKARCYKDYVFRDKAFGTDTNTLHNVMNSKG